MKKVFFLVLVIICIFNFTVYAKEENVFEKQRTYNSEFNDISESDWFFNNVVVSYEYGMLAGKSENAFMPNDNISYAEVITIACRLHTKYKKSSYDFSGGKVWYEPFLSYATNNGLISKGFDFSQAELPTTRADAIDILIASIPDEYLKNENPYIKKVYDMSESKKGYSSVLKAIKSGIINGKDSNGSVYPDMLITRAEISTIIERIMFPDKRTSQVREFYEKREDRLDLSEFYEENKYLPNYGYINNTRYLRHIKYIDGASMYVYEYNEKEIKKFEDMMGKSTNNSLSTTLWDDKNYNYKGYKIRILKIMKFNMMIVIFEWDKEYYNNFKSEMQNTELTPTTKPESFDISDKYLENQKIPNFGKMNNLKSLYHNNYFDEVSKTKYVYDFYPIESVNYCINLTNMNYELVTVDGNRLFLKADFINRSEKITVFMDFMKNTLEISFDKKRNENNSL